jgi:hypothetical protein
MLLIVHYDTKYTPSVSAQSCQLQVSGQCCYVTYSHFKLLKFLAYLKLANILPTFA